MSKTKELNIYELSNLFNKHVGEVVSLNLCSIVNGHVLSNMHHYSRIKSSIVPPVDGEYQTTSGLPGMSIYDERKGIILNFSDSTQLFIDESAKIHDFFDKERNTSIRLKDFRSSMLIHLQILK